MSSKKHSSKSGMSTLLSLLSEHGHWIGIAASALLGIKMVSVETVFGLVVLSAVTAFVVFKLLHTSHATHAPEDEPATEHVLAASSVQFGQFIPYISLAIGLAVAYFVGFWMGISIGIGALMLFASLSEEETVSSMAVVMLVFIPLTLFYYDIGGDPLQHRKMLLESRKEDKRMQTVKPSPGFSVPNRQSKILDAQWKLNRRNYREPKNTSCQRLLKKAGGPRAGRNTFRMLGCEENGLVVGMIPAGKSATVTFIRGGILSIVGTVWNQVDLWGDGDTNSSYRVARAPRESTVFLLGKKYVGHFKRPVAGLIFSEVKNDSSSPRKLKILHNGHRDYYQNYGNNNGNPYVLLLKVTIK